MSNNPTIQDWQAVPARVVQLLPVALAVKEAHWLAAGKDTLLADLAFVTWRPAENTVCVYAPHLTKAAAEKYIAAYKTVMPSSAVSVLSRTPTPDAAEDVLIKKAGIPLLAPLVDYTQKALGGPTPLTNALVGGLVAGGLGYGTGALAENLFPERYVERGKLRRTLGTMGLLGGAGFGAMNAYTNARANTHYKDFWQAPVANTLRGFLMRNDVPPRQINYGPQLNQADVSPSIMDDAAKTASNSNWGGVVQQPFISVPQFNNAVWRDTQLGMYNGFQAHTPPAYAAATTGLMTGLSAGTQSSIISPSDVIRGIASAGVGLATANLAGRALSALAGLTPAGQHKLQDMGLWGGMMHAIVPSMLGIR